MLVLEIAAEAVVRAESVAEAVRLALEELFSEGEAEVLADADEESVSEPVVEDEPVACSERKKKKGVGERRGLAAARACVGKPCECNAGQDSPME